MQSLAEFHTKTTNQLFSIDHSNIWHPFTQEKLYPTKFLVKSAKNEMLNVIDEAGKETQLIDGISSWWVNIHGHCNKYINEKIKEQIDKLEHVMFAGFTHEPAIELVDRVRRILPRVDMTNLHDTAPTLNRAFFSDNGSTSVEVAIKMATQFWHNQNFENKKRIIAFKDSYHGDTVGGMSTSGTFMNSAFKSLMFPVDFVSSPAPNFGRRDKNLSIAEHELFIEKEIEKAAKQSIKEIEKLLELHPNKFSCIIIEPLIQGSGGMKFHSVEFLRSLRKLSRENNVLLIADEVFTGFGRTGDDFACKEAIIVPDIICLSKALTGGYLPMGLTFCTDEIYEAFYSDSRLKAFFHGHSYTANPLACTAGIASFDLYIKEKRLDDVKFINSKMTRALKTPDLLLHPLVRNIRIMGAVAVIELETQKESNYFDEFGPILYQKFLSKGILLRPLGNTLYFMPPYTISVSTLEYCLKTIKEVISELEYTV
jgi:adenosylmethionine-8-amino-7-oxononanoate aminotransferase